MKKTSHQITSQVVSHVAKLANLTITPDKLEEATKQFGSVLDYVSNIQKVDTESLSLPIAGNGSSNTTREDVIDSERTLTQAEALSNAPAQHNGYFLVNSILSE